MRYLGIFLTMFVTACGVTERPHYLINDAELRVYQGGDSLSYSVFDAAIDGDRTGIYSTTFAPRDESPPNNNETTALLFEQQTTTGNIKSPFAPHFFSQDMEGNLILQAFSSGDDIFWLLDDDNTETGKMLYPADITTLDAPVSFTKKLRRCDENNACFDAGQYKLLNLNILGIETVSTPYADFEAFKIEISAELTLLDNRQAGEQRVHSFSGTQWVYPLLGTVRFVYTAGTSTLIGDLSHTNISIDESYKKNSGSP